MFCNQAAWLSDLLMFTLLYQLNGVNYILAKAVSYIVGAAVSYLLNRRFTFGRRGYKRVELPKFVVVNMLAEALSLSSMYVFRNYLGLPVWGVYFLSIIFSFSTNYLGNKFWVFRNSAVE